MSIHHLERAAVLRMPATRKLVLMALCDDADKTTGIALPGLDAVMQWAGCGKSQVQEHLSGLIADGYVDRVRSGARGRRAEFRVFARVACCAEHAPMSPEKASGQPDPAIPDPQPVDNRPAEVNASGKGPERVRYASGPDRTPPQQFIPPSSEGGSSVPDSPAREDRSPSPQDDLGGQTNSVPGPLARPDRCGRHQQLDIVPPCGACKEARMAHEQRVKDALAEVQASAAAIERAPRCEEHAGGRVGHCSGCAGDHITGGHADQPRPGCPRCAIGATA